MKLYQFMLVLTLAGMAAACGGAMANDPLPEPTEAPVTIDPGPPGVRGTIYVTSASLIVMESFPIQVRALVAGDLPTPCHKLVVEVAAADAENVIAIEMYSVVEEDAVCIQMLQPFEESIAIPMEGAPDGHYVVMLNGEVIGEFDYPG